MPVLLSWRLLKELALTIFYGWSILVRCKWFRFVPYLNFMWHQWFSLDSFHHRVRFLIFANIGLVCRSPPLEIYSSFVPVDSILVRLPFDPCHGCWRLARKSGDGRGSWPYAWTIVSKKQYASDAWYVSVRKWTSLLFGVSPPCKRRRLLASHIVYTTSTSEQCAEYVCTVVEDECTAINLQHVCTLRTYHVFEEDEEINWSRSCCAAKCRALYSPWRETRSSNQPRHLFTSAMQSLGIQLQRLWQAL